MSSLDVRAIDEADLRHEACPVTRQEYRVFLAEDAFDRVVARGEGDTTREIGGVLVGELLRDDHGPYLRIEATIDALHAEEKGAELTFTHATWEHIHKEMDTRHKGKRVVGWYHTHPGFGVFLSDRDQFIHRSFFDLPFQVAFVYDPKAKEHGVFTWREAEIARTRRYWIGPREQVWDGPRLPARPADKAGAGAGAGAGADKARAAGRQEHAERAAPAAAAGPEARDEGGPSAIASLIGLGVVLVLIAGFVGHWLGSSSASRALGSAQVDVVKAKAEGAQAAISSLQADLVGVLRETLGDQAMRKPAAAAVAEIDKAIKEIEALRPPAPPAPAPPPAPAAAPTPAAPAPAPGAPAPAAAAPNIEQALAQLATARAGLVRLVEDRSSAEATLAVLEREARRSGGAVRAADVARDLSEQRSGLGALYGELAADAAKAGDAARARRLLAAAAHLDPRNRPRYEKQLQTFDKSGTLPQPQPQPQPPQQQQPQPQPRQPQETAGSAGAGEQR